MEKSKTSGTDSFKSIANGADDCDCDDDDHDSPRNTGIRILPQDSCGISTSLRVVVIVFACC